MGRLKTLRRPPIYPKTPGHLPCSSLSHPLPLPSLRPSVSFGGFGIRQTIITIAIDRDIDVVATNSDGSPERRGFLLSRLGPGVTERVIDPGISVVTDRLSVDGELSIDCGKAIHRWYGKV